MPFTRPTRSELVAQARAELEARLAGADARLRRSFLDVLARILAAAVHGLYGLLDWIFRQAFPDTAESANLRRHAALFGVGELPPQFAAGNIDVAGTDAVTIPAGTTLRREDGREYATSGDGTIAGGVATLPVLATEVGVLGNALEGTALSFVSPVVGVTSAALVAAGGLTGGTDAESDDSLRRRLAERLQTPPAGGTAPDYVARAKLYAEVTDVFVFTGNSPTAVPLVVSETEDAEVDGPWVARGGVPGVRLLVLIFATLADSEQLTISENLQDATDDAGAGAADFGAAVSGEVLVIAPSSGGPHAVAHAYERVVDVAGARDYLRAQIEVGTSAAGDTDWAAAFDLQGDPGGVRIAPLFYDRADPIPTSADLAAIQALMDQPTFRPLLARPLVYALAPVPQDFEIALTPNTTAVQAAVEAELVDLFRREATPGGLIAISRVREAISLAAGETDHTLVSPVANIDLAGNRDWISTVGDFTWS
jgi:uncharacterized phage protein gp47/JayE